MAKDDFEIVREDRFDNPSPQQQRIKAKKGPISVAETFEEGSKYPATKTTYEDRSSREYSGEYNPNDKSVELATAKKGKEFGVNLAKDKIGAFAKFEFKKGGKVRGHGIEKKGKTKGRFV